VFYDIGIRRSIELFFILTNSIFASDLVAEKLAILKEWNSNIDSSLEAEGFKRN